MNSSKAVGCTAQPQLTSEPMHYRHPTKPYQVTVVLLPGVELSGTYHPEQRGDRDTPPVSSHVNASSLKISGPPHLVRNWIAEFDKSTFDAPDWLESMAEDLRTKHEEYLDNLGEYP
jgi:hypothetical protein